MRRRTEHIRKEDEILFPWLDNELDGEQITELSQKFDIEDQKIGVAAEKYQSYLVSLENRFKR